MMNRSLNTNPASVLQVLSLSYFGNENRGLRCDDHGRRQQQVFRFQLVGGWRENKECLKSYVRCELGFSVMRLAHMDRAKNPHSFIANDYDGC